MATRVLIRSEKKKKKKKKKKRKKNVWLPPPVDALVQISKVSEEKSFENVDGRRTDAGYLPIL